MLLFLFLFIHFDIRRCVGIKTPMPRQSRLLDYSLGCIRSIMVGSGLLWMARLEAENILCWANNSKEGCLEWVGLFLVKCLVWAELIGPPAFWVVQSGYKQIYIQKQQEINK